jgi:hypothetical protein
MRFIVKVERKEEDGTLTRAELGQIDSNALQSASDVGLWLFDTKPILTQLQHASVGRNRHCQFRSRVPLLSIHRGSVPIRLGTLGGQAFKEGV